MVDKPEQFEIARNENEPIFCFILKNGHIEIHLKSNIRQIIKPYINVKQEDKTCDTILHRDIIADNDLYELLMFDVKQRELPTTYKNFAIKQNCLTFIEERYNDNKTYHIYNNYYFAFALDDGNKYTGEFLVVKGYDVLKLYLNRKCKLQPDYVLFNENDLRQTDSATIYMSDF